MEMTIRVLVVDDEPLARARACRLLNGVEDIELIGQCVNGEDALGKFIDIGKN